MRDHLKTKFILIMGLINMLLGCKPAATTSLPAFELDLGSFKCGQTSLGTKPNPNEPYASHFNSSGVATFDTSGIELGIKDGVLDYAFITLTNYSGVFLKNGLKISISSQTTPEEVVSQFGEPFWKHTDDEELIFFYEYQKGHIELQFEFPGKRNLGFVTLSRDGVLSKADQRKAYGVSKQWPPK